MQTFSSTSSHLFITPFDSALGTSICKAAHGLDVAEKDDRRMEIFERALKSVDILIEGATVLEYMPFLTSIPTWLPGTGFLRRLAEDKKHAHMLRELPWMQAKEMVVRTRNPFTRSSAHVSVRRTTAD